MKNQTQTSSLPQQSFSKKPHLPNSSPFITAYGPKNRTLLCFPPTEGRTKQSHKAECDINVIMSRYMQTGVIDFVTKHQPHYGDVTALDFTTAMNQIAQAQSMFHDLPSAVRNRFENNPALFLDFIQDPRNKAEAHEMGLLRPDYQPSAPDAPALVLAQPPASPEPSKPD